MPCKQYRLIQKDGLRISQYIARTLDGAAMHSHLRKDNYFYFNCCTGRFARQSCPSYLKQNSFEQLRGGDIDKLEIMNGVFMQALMSRKYTKVPSQLPTPLLLSGIIMVMQNPATLCLLLFLYDRCT